MNYEIIKNTASTQLLLSDYCYSRIKKTDLGSGKKLQSEKKTLCLPISTDRWRWMGNKKEEKSSVFNTVLEVDELIIFS